MTLGYTQSCAWQGMKLGQGLDRGFRAVARTQLTEQNGAKLWLKVNQFLTADPSISPSFSHFVFRQLSGSCFVGVCQSIIRQSPMLCREFSPYANFILVFCPTLHSYLHVATD